MRKVLRAKIHRATITHADVHYEGSITVPPDLMAAADLIPHEAVHIWNVSAGTRFETYAIEGQPDARDICVNGAAAHLVTPGDLIIIAAFTWMPEAEARVWEPKLVFVDSQNRITELRKEVPGPLSAPGLRIS